MRRLVVIALLTGLVAGLPTAATADHPTKKNFIATAQGGKEVPPVASSARVLVTFKVRPDGIKFTMRGRDFSAPVLAAHIHAGGPDVNGPVVIGLCGGSGIKPKCPGKNGKLRVSGLITPAIAAAAGTSIPDLLHSMQRGNELYVNIHTSTFPAGEARDNIVPFAGLPS